MLVCRAFGIVPDELDKAIITNSFSVYYVNNTIANIKYLYLITKTNYFQELCEKVSSGTTGRRNISDEHFINFQIPLPSLSEQEKIVSSYFEKINRAKEREKEAQNIEQEIEKYFLAELGLKPFTPKQRVIGLQTIDFSLLERWDVFSTDTRVTAELKKSKFELVSIGEVFQFVHRNFNKRQFEHKTFKYIEIGAIDPTKGILEAKEIEIKKAPSRATQFIKEGDLIVGTTRPYLKKFAIVPKEYNDNICSSGFSVIKPSNDYHLNFLYQFLNCFYGIEQLKNKMTGGLYPAITENELKKIKIPLPDIEKQKTIMEKIENKKNTILNNKHLAKSLKHQAETEFEETVFE